ncbi:MAG: hypothetical protein K0U47_05685 [Epsilonproteobacteria bacterium]|nr:hypothetical protein [Campylobacterota bacterium]
MRKTKFLMICAVTVIVPTLWASGGTKDVADVYEKRCANCHGVKADGVPKATPRKQMEVKHMHGAGIVSDQDVNMYGSPLKHLTQEELVEKLRDFRNQSFDANSPESVMRDNLKKIEERDGKISDTQMAAYIVNTFGIAK